MKVVVDCLTAKGERVYAEFEVVEEFHEPKAQFLKGTLREGNKPSKARIITIDNEETLKALRIYGTLVALACDKWEKIRASQ